MSIVDVLRDAWTLYTSFLGRFFTIAALVFAVLSLLQFAVDKTREAGVFAVLAIATVAGIYLLQGAIVVAVDDARRAGPTLTIREIFSRVGPRFWPLLGAGLLIAIGVVAGLFLLIIPGLVLLAAWSLAAPAVVLEKRAVIESLGRSWRLVKSDLLRVLAIVVITIGLAIVFSVVIVSILAPLPDAVDSYIATVVANAVSAPFVTLAWTVMFFELRLAKDPGSVPELTARGGEGHAPPQHSAASPPP